MVTLLSVKLLAAAKPAPMTLAILVVFLLVSAPLLSVCVCGWVWVCLHPVPRER